MTDQKLRTQLERLHDEIQKADTVDEKGQRLLKDIDGHIRDLLRRSEDPSPKTKPDLADGLQNAIRHFEVTHPALTAALTDLLTGLSNAGI